MSKARTNPFPGLRPFEPHEHKLFFGREEQYEQMVAKLDGARFLAVVGTSGSGKSSLVRAGLLPALSGGLMPSGTNWRVALFRPKGDPIRELALALNHSSVFGDRGKRDGSSLFTAGDVVDWLSLCAKLSDEASRSPHGVSSRILTFLSPDIRQIILDAAQKNDFEQLRRPTLIQAFNDILTQRDLYQSESFRSDTIKGEAQTLLERGPENLSDSEVEWLNRLLLEATYPQQIAKESDMQTSLTEVTLRRGDRGLIEAVRHAGMAPGQNLLVVVDQFEELFRYARISEHGPHGNQAAAFVKLLLEAKGQTEISIYVVLTMRSDYLGDCAKFWDLPEAINDGQYLIPRLTREQRREAIRGPVRVSGAEITPQLVNQLLNDMGDSPDQLPILQHALMRTWDKWEEEQRPDVPIDIPHYNSIGRMTDALSLHADEAYAELPDARSREVAERLFKCLTEMGPGDREVRRPTTLRELRAVTGSNVKELVTVINIFRAEGRSFLLPTAKRPLGRSTSIDISHESLIRNWKRLRGWVKAEAEAAHTYRRLAEAAILHEKRSFGLLNYLEVQHALKWEAANAPNRAWAARYHSELDAGLSKACGSASTEELKRERDKRIFDGAIGFLKESRRACERAESQRKRRLRVTQVTALVLLGAFTLAFFFWLSAKESRDVAQRSDQITTLLAYATNISAAQGAFNETNYAAAYKVLETLDKDSKYKVLHGIEWDALNRPSLYSFDGGKTFTHDAAVLAVTFLGDDSAFASVSADGVLKRWRAPWADPPPEMLSGPISSATFSPDGKVLATVNSNGTQVDVWDLNAERVVRLKSTKDLGAVGQMAFSPDNKTLLVANGTNVVERLNISGGLLDALLYEKEGGKKNKGGETDETVKFVTVACARDGKVAAGSKDGRVMMWDGPKDGLKLRPMPKGDEPFDIFAPASGQPPERKDEEDAVTALAFSSDGLRLAALVGGMITLWETGSRHTLDYFEVSSSSISSVQFSPDGKKLAAASLKGGLTLLNLETMSEPETLTGHLGAIKSMNFSPDGKIIATASDDKSVRLWSVDLGGKTRVQNEGRGVSFVAFSPDGRKLAAGSRDKEYVQSVHLHDVSAEGGLALGVGVGAVIPAVANMTFSPDGKMFATYEAYGDKGTLVLRDTETQQVMAQWPAPAIVRESPNARKEFLPTAMAFSHSDGAAFAVWNPNDGVKVYNIATGEDSYWRMRSSVPSEVLTAHVSVTSAAFSPGLETLVLGCGDGTVWRGDANTGEWSQLGKPHTDFVSAIAFSSDGQRLATGSADTTVTLWDARTWRNLDTLKGHTATVTSVAFSADGTRLATGSMDNSVKLWDINPEHWERLMELWTKVSRQELATVVGFKGPVLAVAFSPDDKVKTLAIGSADGTVRLW